MGSIYMLTVPRSKSVPKMYAEIWAMLQFFLNNDIKKWIVALEKGNSGYRHYQIRLECRWNEEQAFSIFKRAFGNEAHIEKSDNWNDYERKEGKFLAWNDNPRQLEQRFGKCWKWQQFAIKILENQNDRQVLVIVDKQGKNGKSWLTGHLYETGKAFPCPATLDTVKGLVQFIANGYNNEDYIIIDIPRTFKWTPELAVLLETIKSGLIYDSRYKTTIRNIQAKVMVFTNEEPNRKKLKLSRDRWQIWELENGRLTFKGETEQTEETEDTETLS